MSEKNVIDKTNQPITLDLIYDGLKDMGVERGDVLLVHSSVSSFGWVCGGPQSIIMALMRAVGKEGTIAMAAHSGDWSDPVNWKHPPVPREWVPVIRENMPAFDKNMTPTRGIGKVAELFRTVPDVKRSDHPLLSFSAWGRLATEITAEHPLVPQLGMTSPLGSLYEHNARVLFLGTGFETCTAFHLAESMIDGFPTVKSGTAMIVDGQREWVEFEDIDYNDEGFRELGLAFEKNTRVNICKIGAADCRLFSMKEAVDFARGWLADDK